MMAEIRELSPDVVTLQEVEADHFYDHLKPDMAQMGYNSIQHLRYVVIHPELARSIEHASC